MRMAPEDIEATRSAGAYAKFEFAMNRALRYLGSGRNVAGTALALGGLGLHLVGVVGDIWPLVVPALYLIGALVVPSPAPPVEADPLDAATIRLALDGTLEMARGRVPADVFARLTGLRQRTLALLPRARELPGGSRDLYMLQRTATDYLPTSVRHYVALPEDYATTHVVQDGKTPLQVLHDQLDLLDAEMVEIGDAVTRRDSDRLLAQGRFLEERFGGRGGELKLPKR
jgi:hypothetical protein